MPRYWDSNHGARWPQLEEELDTAWVSEVGGGSPPPAAAQFCAPVSFVWPSRPLPAGSAEPPGAPRPVRPPPPPPPGNNAGQCLRAGERAMQMSNGL
ncbi:unnamed protein product [Rangifer tarandus platyrhynchus]|uniref:Uncharacterized protein n=1 Tax=Rangifer tarandus platyrhynchus TaxID=3082113 RepID=A0AC59Y1F2_RANTA